tara:strand:+ start:252 stop:602 length:351 start_codon:yes stop_codon:yes gene_type:complete
MVIAHIGEFDPTPEGEPSQRHLYSDPVSGCAPSFADPAEQPLRTLLLQDALTTGTHVGGVIVVHAVGVVLPFKSVTLWSRVRRPSTVATWFAGQASSPSTSSSVHTQSTAVAAHEP